MAALTDNEKEFYSNLDNTFRSTGWNLLVKGWQEEQQRLPVDAFFNAQSLEDVRAARVRYGLLDELINLPDTIEQQKLNLLEAREQGSE